MSYSSGSGSTGKASRDSQLHRELQEQQQLEEKGEAAAERWEQDQIGALFNQLDRYTVDGPSGQQKESLLALAAAYATQPQPVRSAAESSIGRVARDDRPARRQPAVAVSLPVRLMQRMAVQARTMHWLFWLISALVVGAGAAIEGLTASELFSSPRGSDVFLFAILLLPVASVAYSLRSMHTPMGELEATFPVTPVQLLVARIGTILLYNLLLALLFYGILGMTGTSGEFGFSTALLITELLLPICLSTFASLAAMLRFGTWPGTAVVLAGGVIQFFAGERLGVLQLFSEYGSTHWLASKLVAVLLAAALGVCTGMLLRRRHYYKQYE